MYYQNVSDENMFANNIKLQIICGFFYWQKLAKEALGLEHGLVFTSMLNSGL